MLLRQHGLKVFFRLVSLIPGQVLLMLAGQLSDGAFWIPFYQQLSSEKQSTVACLVFSTVR